MSAEVEGDEELGIWVLPLLVLKKIFRNLVIEDKRSARLVCPLWRLILDDPDKPNYAFRVLVRSDSDYKSLMDSCRKIWHVHFDRVTAPSSATKFPAAQGAVLWRNNYWSNIVEFLTKPRQNVKTLKIDSYGLEKADLTQISLITSEILRHLSSLQLNLKNINSELGKQHAVAFENFLKSLKLPQLSELSISVLDAHASEDTANLFTEVYDFIGRHSAKLKALEIRLGDKPYVMTERPWKRPTQKKPYMFIHVTKITRLSISSRLKLKTLKIVDNFRSYAAILKPILLESSTLSKLEWNLPRCSNMHSSALCLIIMANKATLEEVKVNPCSYITFNIICVRNCPNLRSLYIGNCFEWKYESHLDWENLKNLTIVAKGSQDMYGFSFHRYMARCFHLCGSFKYIENFRLYTPAWVYDVQYIQDILALADFKQFLVWTTSNENLNQIRTHFANIPDVIFSNKKCRFENIDGWETTITRKGSNVSYY